MPRLSHSVPKYRKHRASGQAVVEIAGRTHYLGPHGTKASQVEYDRIVAEWLAAGRSVSFGTPSQALTVAELLVAYLCHVRKRYIKNGRPTTEQQLIKMAMKPVRSLYGRTASADFGPVALRAIRLRMIEAGHARKTVNDNLRRIRRMFRWGVAEQIVGPMVLQSLEAVEGLRMGEEGVKEGKPVLPVPEVDLQATLPCLSETVSDMVRFQRLTGCRPAEVCVIRPIDLDKSADVWQYRPESHKTEHHGKERLIFVGSRAQAVLRPYLLRAAESYCFSPVDAERKRREAMTAKRKTPLSCGNVPGSNRKKKPKRTPRERYDTDSYRRSVHRACDKAGIARWSPNRLRHSAATEIRKTHGLEAAQVTLGHASANVTQVYAERDQELAIRVAREVG